MAFGEEHILFEDNHILVVEKPPGVPSQEDKTRDSDLLSQVKYYLKQRYQKPGEVYLGLIHRLDRPTGGAMVLAKTSKAASRLSEQMRQKTIQKKYLCLVHGIPDPSEGEWRDFLFKIQKENYVKVVSADKAGAKEALLRYRLVETIEKLSWVEVELLTGRSHQIRVQFSSRKHPLVGDRLYGKGLKPFSRYLALWAWELSFEHPVKKERMTFHSLPKREGFPWKLLPETIK